MTVRTYLPWAAGLLVAASAALGYAATRPDPEQPNPTPPKPALVLVAANEPVPAKAEPKPLPASPNRILLYRSGDFVLIDPDGKNEKKVSTDRDLYHPSGVRLSPDGKQLAVLVAGPLPPDDGTREAKPRTMTLHVRGIDEKEPGTNLGVESRTFVWSPDGTEIACTEVGDGPREKGPPPATHYVVNVKTKAKAKLDLPADHIITDWTRDGKFLVTTSIEVAKGGRDAKARIHLIARDRSARTTLAGEMPFTPFGPFARISPDGKRVLYLVLGPQHEGAPKDAKPRYVLTVADVATGKATKVEDVPLNGEVQGYAWSPDGKKIAYTWRESDQGNLEDLADKDAEAHLVVCDPDGKNQKTVLTEKGKARSFLILGQIDWR